MSELLKNFDWIMVGRAELKSGAKMPSGPSLDAAISARFLQVTDNFHRGKWG